MKISSKISALAIIAAMLSVTPALAATLNIGGTGSGGLLNINGTTTNPTVDVLTNGTVNNGSPSGTATTNALDNAGGPTTAAVRLGAAGTPGDATASALLDLFGPATGGTTAAALGSGNGANVGAALDLFGNSSGNGGGNGGGGTSGSGGSAAGRNTAISGSANGTNGSSSNSLTTKGISVASADSSASDQCFAPNATQMARLTNRHDYSGAAFADLASVSSVAVVSTNLCGGARSSIAENANIARLQAFVSSNATLKSVLAKQGRSPRDVVALDKKGDTLTLYVS